MGILQVTLRYEISDMAKASILYISQCTDPIRINDT